MTCKGVVFMHHTIVSRQTEGAFRYQAWPTVARAEDGKPSGTKWGCLEIKAEDFPHDSSWEREFVGVPSVLV